MSRIPIPVDCSDCGVCCLHVGVPPFVGAEIERLPETLLAEMSMARWFRWPEHGPCAWYDAATKKCIHHEHRPQICRDFEVGCEVCVEFRRMAGVTSTSA